MLIKFKNGVTRAIHKGLRRNWFVEGNGEKILKAIDKSSQKLSHLNR